MTRPLLDLAAVCERHGITYGQSTDRLWWCETPDKNPGVAGYATPSGAVCALLKARYGITTRPHPYQWSAWPPVRLVPIERMGHIAPEGFVFTGQSELEAVVAQADHLLTTPDATTGGRAEV
jgi:hypothetical protein